MQHYIKRHYHKLFSTANAEASTFAIRTVSAMLIAIFLAFLFHFSAPYWAAITVIVLMNTYAGLTIQKGIYRVVGTVMGALIGLIIAHYVSNIYTLLISAFFIIFILQYLSQVSYYPYAFILCGATTFMVLGSVVSGVDVPLQMAVWRCSEITLGVVVVSVVAFCILPKDPSYWLQTEINNYFNCCHHLCDYINLTQIKKEHTASKNSRSINELATIFEKIKTHYAAYSQEPDRVSNHLYSINYLIETLKKLENIFKLMLLNLEPKENFYWKHLFKDEIERLTTVIQEIFLKLGQSEPNQLSVDFRLLSLSEEILEEIKKKIYNMRSSGEIYNYTAYANQALYVFLIQQQQLLDIFKKLAEKIQYDIKVKDNFSFLKIFSLKKDVIIIRHAIKTALASTLAMFIWIWGGWPGGLQGIVSVIAIATNIYINDMWQYSLKRLIGCAIGGLIGLISLHFLIYNIVDLLIIVFIIGFVFAFYTNRSKKFSYAALQANVAFMMTLVQAGGPTDSIEAPLGRLSGIVLGIVCIMLINYLIWPLNAKEILLKNVKALSENLSKFLLECKKTLLQENFLEKISTLQSGLVEANKLYLSINSTLNEATLETKTIKMQLDKSDFILFNLSMIMQHVDLQIAFEIAEKTGINLKEILFQALDLLQCYMSNHYSVFQTRMTDFQKFITMEYSHARQLKKSLAFSLDEMAHLNYVIYQLRGLVAEMYDKII